MRKRRLGGGGFCGGKLGVWWKNGDFYRKMRVWWDFGQEIGEK